MNNETDSYIEGPSRNQTFLLPKNIEEYVETDNPVRFIDAYVNTLDMEKLGFTHSKPQELGRPSYNPKDLCKLYLYRGLNHIRSSRKLERECKTNLEAMWLLKGLAPDFKTIADFRKDNPSAIGALFKEFVSFLKDLSLYGAKQVTVDGTKLRAVNSNDKAFTQRALAKRIKVMEKSVEHYLHELDAADEQEASDERQASEAGQDAKAFEVDKLASLLEKKEKSEEILDKMEKSCQKEVALTDPDCRQMMNHGRVESCYNMQAAVDSKNHLIVNYVVTNEASDLNQLSRVAISAKETLGVEHIDCLSDKGYYDFVEIKQCVDNGVTPYVAVKKSGKGGSSTVSSEFTADKFRYDKRGDVYVCPAGQRLLFCCCSTVRNGMEMRIYRCQKGVCSSCQFLMTKCTGNKKGRVIWRWVHEGVVDDMRRRMRLHPEVMGERKKVVEHTFGTLKRAFGAPFLLLRGLTKVSGEVGLLLFSYNLRRALNILGVETLIGALAKK
jgi:transposase